mgnify:CR=1 FL=1|jgi:hypothetical protein
MCWALREMRERERQLAKTVAEAKLLEESIFRASQDIIDALRQRRSQLAQLKSDSEVVERDLRRVVDNFDEDEEIQWASKKIQFYLSEDANTNDIMWNLRNLEKEWEEVRAKVELKRTAIEVRERKGWWFW